jgi:hypothetical protein
LRLDTLRGYLGQSITKSSYLVKFIVEKNQSMTNQERIVQLESEIAELKARLPKHSVPAAMIVELEDLEDELEMLRTRSSRERERTLDL